MGNNHSKLCSGVAEQENRRAAQERIQWLYPTPQFRGASYDPAQATLHIHCREDEVDQFLKETNAASIVFHFKVEKAPVIKPEDGVTQPLAEQPGATGTVASFVVGSKAAGPGEDVMETLEPNRDISARTEAHPSELDLHVVEQSFPDSSERTKHSAGEDPPPSSPEPQFTPLSSDSQTTGPPSGAAVSGHAGDVHHPNEDAFLAHDWKAPCETGPELAVENASGAAEGPATGNLRLEEASSEEAREEAGGAPPRLGSAETSGEGSDAKAALGSEELAEILLGLGNDLPRAAGEPPSVPNGTEEKGPEGCRGVGNPGAQLEVLPETAPFAALSTVDAEDKRERPGASKIFPTSESVHTLCKKTNGGDLLLSSDVADLDSLPTDGASPTPEAAQGNECQASVARNVKTRFPPDVAEMTVGMSPPKALLEAAEKEWGSAPSCSAEPTAQVSRTEDNHASARPSPVPLNVSGPPLEDGSPAASLAPK